MLMLLLVSNIGFVADKEPEDGDEVVGESEEDDGLVGGGEGSVFVARFESWLGTRNTGGARIAGGRV